MAEIANILVFGSLKPHKTLANFGFCLELSVAGSIIAEFPFSLTLSLSLSFYNTHPPFWLIVKANHLGVSLSLCQSVQSKNLCLLRVKRVSMSLSCPAPCGMWQAAYICLCVHVCAWNDNECVVIFSILCLSLSSLVCFW